MIPSKMRPALWEFCHGRTRAAEGPLASDIIEILFQTGGMASQGLRESSQVISNATRNSLHCCLGRLKRRGLVKSSDGKKYSLTSLGEWLVISRRLALSFVELCALVLACRMESRFEKIGIKFCCTRSSFDEIFKEYYSKRYIDTVFSSLRRKGFATRHSKRALVVGTPVRKSLMEKYGLYFERLEMWMNSLKANEIEIFSSVLENRSHRRYLKRVPVRI
ncbi:MAG TPA: hypothetical protein VJ792_03875 [Candidatus Nitrosotalea sp.]|nr:hypothetical protein [Candidatus Nitrosotalea sp.]